MKRVNKDCPFSIEELDDFRDKLYRLNTTLQTTNSPPEQSAPQININKQIKTTNKKWQVTTAISTCSP